MDMGLRDMKINIKKQGLPSFFFLHNCDIFDNIINRYKVFKLFVHRIV